MSDDLFWKLICLLWTVGFVLVAVVRAYKGKDD